jgi:hypothetical protein
MDRDLAEMRIKLTERRERKNQKIGNGEGRHGRSSSDQDHHVGGSVGRVDTRPLPAIESNAPITDVHSSELRSSRLRALPLPSITPPSPSSIGFNLSPVVSLNPYWNFCNADVPDYQLGGNNFG